MAPSPTEKKDAEAVQDYSAAWAAIMRLARAGSSWSGRERHCAFLNCGDVEQGARFANVSAVSGLDFPDDEVCGEDTDTDDEWFDFSTAGPVAGPEPAEAGAAGNGPLAATAVDTRGGA